MPYCNLEWLPSLQLPRKQQTGKEGWPCQSGAIKWQCEQFGRTTNDPQNGDWDNQLWVRMRVWIQWFSDRPSTLRLHAAISIDLAPSGRRIMKIPTLRKHGAKRATGATSLLSGVIRGRARAGGRHNEMNISLLVFFAPTDAVGCHNLTRGAVMLGTKFAYCLLRINLSDGRKLRHSHVI